MNKNSRIKTKREKIAKPEEKLDGVENKEDRQKQQQQ
jgi:hypothetical protein